MDPKTVAILNALKGPPANILLALLSSARPLGTNDLIFLTGWCHSSVTAGLQKLELLGWVERVARYDGWDLVHPVRNSILPKIFSVPDPTLPAGAEPTGHCEILSSQPSGEPEGVRDLDGNCEILRSQRSSDDGEVQGLDGNGEIQRSRPPQARVSPARRSPLFKKRRASRDSHSSQSAEESLEEDLIFKAPNPSSSDSDSARAPQNGPPGRQDPLLSSADVGKILAATRQLFGERVMGDPARYPDPVLLLAAIAEAYQNRHILRKPARVVFTNLRNETNIDPKYFSDPCAYLPDSFLQATGLPQSQAGSKSDHHRYLEGLPAYECCEEGLESPSLPDPHPSLFQRVGDHASRTAVDAWTMAKIVLEAQLEKCVYQTYLARAFLAHYDSSSNTFTIAVEDPFTCNWLQERSVRLVERLLNGICNRPAAVQYLTVDQLSGQDPDTGGSPL